MSRGFFYVPTPQHKHGILDVDMAGAVNAAAPETW